MVLICQTRTCILVKCLTTSLMMLQRKVFLGARLARLRRERGLNQSQMAEQLGISGSYLNHLERNQRPVTAGILLRLAETFDVDVKSFAAEGGESSGRGDHPLRVLSHPLHPPPC